MIKFMIFLIVKETLTTNELRNLAIPTTIIINISFIGDWICSNQAHESQA